VLGVGAQVDAGSAAIAITRVALRHAGGVATADHAVVGLGANLAAGPAVRAVAVQFDASIAAGGEARRTACFAALRAALGRAVDRRRTGNPAVSAVFWIGAHADAGARAILVCARALPHALPRGAGAARFADVPTGPTIAGVLLGIHAQPATLHEAIVAGAPARSLVAARHTVGRSVADQPAVPAVERVVGLVHATRSAGFVAFFARVSTLGSLAGGVAVLRSRTGHAANPAMHGRAVGVDTGACAVGRAGAALVGAMALRANLASAALLRARTATRRIARDIDARAVAFFQRLLAAHLTRSADAAGGAAQFTALLSAAAAVVRIILEIDAHGPARIVSVVAGELAAAVRARRLPVCGGRAGRPAAAAVVRVVLEHDALRATHGLAVATCHRGVTRVATDVASVAGDAALVLVARTPIQITG